MAVERVERLLRTVTNAFNDARLDYAVIGGNAVAAWVATVDEDAVRSTKDVDLVVRRADLARLAAALTPHGFEPAEVLGVHMFLEKEDPSPKRGVHLIIAGEKIHPHNVHAAPDPAQSVMSRHGFRIIELVELLKMKLQAFRAVDRTHLIDMHGVGLITPEVVAQLSPDLKMRLETALREG